MEVNWDSKAPFVNSSGSSLQLVLCLVSKSIRISGFKPVYCAVSWALEDHWLAIAEVPRSPVREPRSGLAGRHNHRFRLETIKSQFFIFFGSHVSSSGVQHGATPQWEMLKETINKRQQIWGRNDWTFMTETDAAARCLLSRWYMQARLVKFRGDANYVMVIHRPIYIYIIYIYIHISSWWC